MDSCLTTPLKRQKQTDHTRNQRRRAKSIQLPQFLCPRKFGRVTVWNLETGEDDNKRKSTNGEVDVETPPPGYVRRESSSDQGTDDRSKTEEGTEEALDHGTLR
jgi:hypothetical protein